MPTPPRLSRWEKLLELSAQGKSNQQVLQYWHAQVDAGHSVPIEDKMVRRAVLHACNVVLREAQFIVASSGIQEKDLPTLRDALLGFAPHSPERKKAERAFDQLCKARKSGLDARDVHAYAQAIIDQRARIRQQMTEAEVRRRPNPEKE